MLGDGSVGIHYSLLLTLYIFEMFPSKTVLGIFLRAVTESQSKRQAETGPNFNLPCGLVDNGGLQGCADIRFLRKIVHFSSW